MKTLQKLLLVIIVVGFTSCYSQRTQVNAHNNGQISFQTFYNELAPYGQWVEDYDYGYLWIPHVNRNFQPYASDGYWTMTNYGNTWVSDFSWGWAPFHYGRWIRDDFLGWAWIPGYEWAPAWVSWRSGGGQYGWAPMGPRMSVNVNVNIPWSHWTFLPQRYMYGPNMHRYYNRGNRNYYNQTTIINNTNIYNNYTYYSGPSVQDVERSTGRRVSVRNVNNSSRSGRTSVSDRSVSMYRPEVARNSGRNERPASASNRSSVNRGTSSSGRTSTTPSRDTNVDRNTNRTTPENTRNSGTVNRSTQTQREATESNRSNSTNRTGSGNQSTQRQTEPTRNSSGTVNRSNATTNQSRTGSETVNSRSTTRQNSSSATGAGNRSSTTTRQSAPTRSATTNTRSNSSVSTSRSRGAATQSTTRSSSNTNKEENSSTRSSSSRSGRGR